MEDYNHDMDKIFQEMADREERALVADMQDLPATMIEIRSMRDAGRKWAVEQGYAKTVESKEAHKASDEFLRRCMDQKIFGPHFKVEV
jgi:hypothetical protein